MCENSSKSDSNYENYLKEKKEFEEIGHRIGRVIQASMKRMVDKEKKDKRIVDSATMSKAFHIFCVRIVIKGLNELHVSPANFSASDVNEVTLEVTQKFKDSYFPALCEYANECINKRVRENILKNN